MNIATKKVDYRDHHYIIKVKMNTKVEKRINGDRYHTISTQIEDNEYTSSEDVLDGFLIMRTKETEETVKRYIDQIIEDMSPVDKRLLDLGFK